MFGYNGEITRHEPLNSKVRVTKTKRNEEKLTHNAADFEKKNGSNCPRKKASIERKPRKCLETMKRKAREEVLRMSGY